ncbi:hypothetical protein BKA56DRAFT_620095 [Ilyonectria sp. MPI-CAGE-AT-0026]|nr:hypothetical protein BKA56DRAFT_620095 [Ilyonectria sp. MPI-CAGE-AT-0026]
MDMIIGVFVKETGGTYDTPDIKKQAQWDLVKLFIVGNEAIINNYYTTTELAELVTIVKSKCSNYTGPYTIAETLNIWQQGDVAHFSGLIILLDNILSHSAHGSKSQDLQMAMESIEIYDLFRGGKGRKTTPQMADNLRLICDLGFPIGKHLMRWCIQSIPEESRGKAPITAAKDWSSIGAGDRGSTRVSAAQQNNLMKNLSEQKGKIIMHSSSLRAQ